jgi:hypothetical protein
MIILGAGMGGCIAAILNGDATILEASGEPPTNHKAVLRFRTDTISKMTGIPFKKVRVHKAIFYDDQLHTQCNPFLANQYSKKVAGKILSRSVWDLASVDRYVAPGDFHQRLLNMVGDRVKYNAAVEWVDANTIMLSDTGSGQMALHRAGIPVISTIPMPVMSKLTGIYLDQSLFKRQPITTARAKVANCDVNQTVYYPDFETKLYRATLTGDDLIMEFTGDGVHDINDEIRRNIFPAFGLYAGDVIGPLQFGTQQYGKIAPVESGLRKSFMFELTRQMGIYSLGRFAAWRNILLDDVFNDVLTIRRMIEQSHYDIRKEMC